MELNTCSRAGVCLGMHPPCMANCQLNDDPTCMRDDDADLLFAEPLLWFCRIAFWVILFGLAVGVCFLAGYYIVHISHAAHSAGEFFDRLYWVALSVLY